MNHFSFELSLIAVLPALFLCGYVFYKDRIEKEPIGLLAILLGIGAVAYVPAYLVQELAVGLIDKGFADKMARNAEGLLTFTDKGSEMTHLALCSFTGFALIRICLKWLVLFFVTRKNKNFNYLFDGIVYSVFISLGFCLCENAHFIIQNDWDMLVAKLLSSVPCHLFIGVLMGYYYTMWHMRFAANSIESDMLKAGIVEKDNIRSSAIWLIASFVIPLAVDGTYIFAGSVKNETVNLIFYTGVFLLFGISFIVIDSIASRDGSYGRYLYRIIAKGHPELSPEQISSAVKEEIGEQTVEPTQEPKEEAE